MQTASSRSPADDVTLAAGGAEEPQARGGGVAADGRDPATVTPPAGAGVTGAVRPQAAQTATTASAAAATASRRARRMRWERGVMLRCCPGAGVGSRMTKAARR